MSPVTHIRPFLLALLAFLGVAAAVPAASMAVVAGSAPNGIRPAGHSDADPAARYSEFPWTVAIVARDGTALSQFCGGTLIDDTHVLTAAHCIDPGGDNQATPDSIDVIVGQSDLIAGCTPNTTTYPPCTATDNTAQVGTRIHVSDISLDGLANVSYFYYDVAMLTLADKIPDALHSAIVQPVAVGADNTVGSSPSDAPDSWGPETAVSVFGWGLLAPSDPACMAPWVLRMGSL
ncbi:MAG: trypsin-like serine protease, partial [Patulibacter sp.]|nr:trypsin-like serine protease [Patulibacter sp.]